MSRIGLFAVVLLGVAGCTGLANSSLVVNHLKVVSAGHTGIV